MHAQILSSLWTPQCHGSLEKVVLINNANAVEDNQEKTLRKNLTATPFSYINDASVNLNEVCLHITYLFLKELVFVIAVFLLALLSHEYLHSFPGVVSRVFSPESTPLVIQQSPLLS